MVIEVQEHEMIERYSEGLSKSASRAKEFMTAQEIQKPALFVDFIDGLKVAAGSSHQLAIYQENPNFLTIRDKLEAVIEFAQNLPTFNGNQAGLWSQIKHSLEAISKAGVTMARSKAMNRSDVLANLSFRQSQLQ